MKECHEGPSPVIGVILAGVIGWWLIGDGGRAWVRSALAELAEAAQRQAEERERRQRLAKVLQNLRPALAQALKETFSQASASLRGPGPGSLETLSVPPALLLSQELDSRWRRVIVHPSVVLVLGKRGSGKSALGYRLLELHRYALRPYVVGVPASARSLLPDWTCIAPTLDEVPPKSIALIDEAYLAYHARASSTREARAMSQLLNLSRRREQTLLFVSQEARQVDRNIASSANVVVFKDLGILQLEFDRPELGKLAAQARQAFTGVTGDRRRWSYVYAPETETLGLLENELPSFWKPDLSRLFAAESVPAQPRAARPTSPQGKAQRAREMRAQGASYGEIAQALGVSRGTVVNYLKGYPYRS